MHGDVRTCKRGEIQGPFPSTDVVEVESKFNLSQLRLILVESKIAFQYTSLVLTSEPLALSTRGQ